MAELRLLRVFNAQTKLVGRQQPNANTLHNSAQDIFGQRKSGPMQCTYSLSSGWPMFAKEGVTMTFRARGRAHFSPKAERVLWNSAEQGVRLQNIHTSQSTTNRTWYGFTDEMVWYETESSQTYEHA